MGLMEREEEEEEGAGRRVEGEGKEECRLDLGRKKWWFEMSTTV